MKNKKGFTLVELLAVIVILAVLATVATPLVMTAAKKSKQKMYTAKVKMIKAAAESCGEDSCRTVKALCDNGYLSVDENIKPDSGSCACQQNPIDNACMDDCVINYKPGYGGRIKVTFPVSNAPDPCTLH